MKAEMGVMSRAMTNAGISFDNVPNQSKANEQAVNGMQKNKFDRAAKKNKRPYKVAQESMVPVLHRDEVTDSDDEPQPEYGNIAIVVKPKHKHGTIVPARIFTHAG